MAKDPVKTNEAITPTQATPDIRTQQKAMVAPSPQGMPSRSGAVNRSATKPPVPTAVTPMPQPAAPKPINITPPKNFTPPPTVKPVPGYAAPKISTGASSFPGQGQAQAPTPNGRAVGNPFTASTGTPVPATMPIRATEGKASFFNPQSFKSPMAQEINKGVVGNTKI